MEERGILNIPSYQLRQVLHWPFPPAALRSPPLHRLLEELQRLQCPALFVQRHFGEASGMIERRLEGARHPRSYLKNEPEDVLNRSLDGIPQSS